MASTIIPLSLQEPVLDHGLDIACLCVPWLFTMGFVAAVAAMLFKLVGLNKVSMLNIISICRGVDIHSFLTTLRCFNNQRECIVLKRKLGTFGSCMLSTWLLILFYCSRGLLLHCYGGLKLRY
jgi:hypothetical protein